MNRGRFLKNSIAFVWVVVLICCVFVILISMLRLPEVPTGARTIGSNRYTKIRKVAENEHYSIGRFGEMMIQMLPEDLAFTIFVPSEKAFERDLRLRANDRSNDTYAIVSRILGFSAIPRTLTSVDVPLGKEMLYDSISGFVLDVSKDIDGMLVVNRVRSERVDLRKKQIVVHVMDGVLMDAEFEESLQPDDDDDEQK
ncbi:hypothetical protein UlMin_045370 [Ulmus minor]